MIYHFLKTTIRNLVRHKTHSAINILGLSIGLGITLLIWMFLLYEKSYDRFFDDYDQIYRVHNTISVGTGESQTLPTAMFHTTDYAVEELPEIEEYVRFNGFFRSPALSFKDKTVYLNDIMLTDSTFFSVFNMSFLAGSPQNALSETNSMVLTRSSSRLLFDSPSEAYGQMVTFNDSTYQVTAVIEDIPDNSHIHFTGLIPHYGQAEPAKRSGYNWYTYYKLRSGTDLEQFAKKLDDISIHRVIQGNPMFEGITINQESYVMNIADIHLNSSYIWEMKENGNKRNLMIFGALSIFVLVVAVINFVNLATARSSLRSKEIGVRKVCGATRFSLVRQFLAESFLVTLIAFFLAMGMAEIFKDYFTNSLGLVVESSVFFTPGGIGVLLAIFMLTGFLAGMYPAMYLSSFEGVKILKGEQVKGTGGKGFRRSLVVFQFLITIVLLSSLWAVNRQVKHLQAQDMGFDQEQVLVVRNVSHQISGAFQAVCAQLENQTRVESTAGANFVFAGSNRVDLIREEGMAMESGVTADIINIDHDFLDLLDLDLLKGRNFHEGSQMDIQSAFILNETAVQALSFDSPLDKNLDLFGARGPLIGVVKDFHLKSLHHNVEPLVFMYAPSGFPHIYLKVSPGNMQQVLQQVSGVLAEFDAAYIPDFVFLDDTIQAFYEREESASGLLSVGTLLAIVIAMLGVYGLAAFTAERRVKEMGVRRVLGASMHNLLWIFNKESLLMVIVAFVIAVPLSWYFLEGWLDSFLVRVPVNPLWFVAPGLGVLMMSSLIISAQTWIASHSNPVNSLRSE